METEIAGTLDLGPIHLSLGALSDELKEIKRIYLHNLIQLENSQDLNGSVIYSTADASLNFIDLGHPSAGFKWTVRAIQVGGSDITQTPAGVGWILVQAVPPTINPALFTVMDWTKAALPQSAFYGRGEIVVRQMEHLYVLLTGGANNTQYVASASVQEFQEFIPARP
jgi:hypothetical protein